MVCIRLQALLGAGGMGEVYRARDMKLERDVAVKFLPHAFASDPERLARFQREARMLAALNHPNIGAIYGFEEVEGPTTARLQARRRGDDDDSGRRRCAGRLGIVSPLGVTVPPAATRRQTSSRPRPHPPAPARSAYSPVQPSQTQRQKRAQSL